MGQFVTISARLIRSHLRCDATEHLFASQAEKDVGQFVTSFGKGFTVLEQELEKDLTGEEKVRVSNKS